MHTYASCERTSNINERQPPRSIKSASPFRETMADYICSSYFVVSLQIEGFVTSWNLELTKAEVQLMELLILEHVRKLYAIQENFDSLFKHHTVQEDWLFRTRNHLEKLEKAERRRKLKKLRKLSNNETLYFKGLESFESYFELFSFKFNFLEFCNNFVPDFENL